MVNAQTTPIGIDARVHHVVPDCAHTAIAHHYDASLLFVAQPKKTKVQIDRPDLRGVLPSSYSGLLIDDTRTSKTNFDIARTVFT